MNKILFPKGTIVIGGSGMTGYYIDDSVPNFDLKNGFDITEPGILRAIFEETNPDHVLLLAAETNVQNSETNPKDCFDVNTRAAYETAALCKEFNADLYFISSVDVFDGQKDGPYEVGDPENPIVVYGHSKLAAEGAIRKILPSAVIVRAGWMFGGFGRDKKFCSYAYKTLRAGREFKAVDDRIGSPTYAKHLIATIANMITWSYPLGKTYHVCCEGQCTRYDEACLMREIIGRGSVAPVSSDEFPDFRSLQNATMKSSVPSPHWIEALTDYISEWVVYGDMAEDFLATDYTNVK